MKHLSRFDIEAIADKYVQAYMALPDVRNTQIYRIDPELLLEKVLGLNVEYQHLSYLKIMITKPFSFWMEKPFSWKRT